MREPPLPSCCSHCTPPWRAPTHLLPTHPGTRPLPLLHFNLSRPCRPGGAGPPAPPPIPCPASCRTQARCSPSTALARPRRPGGAGPPVHRQPRPAGGGLLGWPGWLAGWLAARLGARLACTSTRWRRAGASQRRCRHRRPEQLRFCVDAPLNPCAPARGRRGPWQPRSHLAPQLCLAAAAERVACIHPTYALADAGGPPSPSSRSPLHGRPPRHLLLPGGRGCAPRAALGLADQALAGEACPPAAGLPAGALPPAARQPGGACVCRLICRTPTPLSHCSASFDHTRRLPRLPVPAGHRGGACGRLGLATGQSEGITLRAREPAPPAPRTASRPALARTHRYLPWPPSFHPPAVAPLQYAEEFLGKQRCPSDQP